MNREEVYAKLSEIFEDVFDKKVELNEETQAKDVDGWDSLTHITLIARIEDAFDMKFTMHEVLNMKNLGEMVDIIIRES